MMRRQIQERYGEEMGKRWGKNLQGSGEESGEGPGNNRHQVPLWGGDKYRNKNI
jgi:hypothetical protein